jgi:hypothetical protein
MKLYGKPNATINRFGNVYRSDNKGIIESSNDEETAIFTAYGFTEEIEVPVTEVV